MAACGVHYGMAGGGLPANVRTMAILPFDNQTSSPDLTKELYDRMHDELQHKLGVRDASQDRADAIARGTITQYDVDVPVAYSADPRQSVSARRRLQITIQVQIVDQSSGQVLYAGKDLREEADYAEGAEAAGREQAVEKLVQRIIEGVQANW
jgi:TolB-like protein